MKYQTPRVIDLSARARTALGSQPVPDAASCAAGDSPLNTLDCYTDCYAGFSAATCLHGACPSEDGGTCRSGTSFH
jgi:hypothetical protein